MCSLFRRRRTYLDEFSDEELKSWINDESNTEIDRIMKNYIHKLSNNNFSKYYVGFRTRNHCAFNQLELDELPDYLNYYKTNSIILPRLKEHLIAMLEKEALDKNNSSIAKSCSEQYNKARELERVGKVDVALNLYLDILDNYVPTGSVYYERPCILLEKLKRYDEAINICKIAIGRAEHDNYHFGPSDFINRLKRLESKVK